MDDIQRYIIEAQINRCVVDYWDEVDSRWGEKAHEMYTEDGKFQKMNGRAEIRAFYDWRKGRGDRSSFHFVLNMKVDVESSERATARYVMMLYGADGVPPIDVKAPNTISDAVEVFVKEPSGWKIKSKMMKVIFQGGEPTTVMPDSILDQMRRK